MKYEAVVAVEGMPMAGDPYTVYGREAIQAFGSVPNLTIRERPDGKLEAVCSVIATPPPKSDEQLSWGARAAVIEALVKEGRTEAEASALIDKVIDRWKGWGVSATGIPYLGSDRILGNRR
jgi:hypothetical protein